MISKGALVLAELDIWKQRYRLLSIGIKLNWNELLRVKSSTR